MKVGMALHFLNKANNGAFLTHSHSPQSTQVLFCELFTLLLTSYRVAQKKPDSLVPDHLWFLKIFIFSPHTPQTNMLYSLHLYLVEIVLDLSTTHSNNLL